MSLILQNHFSDFNNHVLEYPFAVTGPSTTVWPPLQFDIVFHASSADNASLVASDNSAVSFTTIIPCENLIGSANYIIWDAAVMLWFLVKAMLHQFLCLMLLLHWLNKICGTGRIYPFHNLTLTCVVCSWFPFQFYFHLQTCSLLNNFVLVLD